MEYAGFWVRLAAKLLDGILIGIINTFIGLTLGVLAALLASSSPSGFDAMGAGLVALSYLIGFAVGAAYYAYFLPRHGATPGKMIVGLQVLTPLGARLSTGQAVGRFFAEILSAMLLYIGYLIVLADDQRRALHDHLCSTRVVKQRSGAGA